MTDAYGVLGKLHIPLGLGLLRLGTAGRPDEANAIALIHAALDAGIRLLDTADAYCLGPADLHYGEKLARQAVDAWKGPKREVRILTKTGMTRPQGKWVPNGKPDHLRKAVDGSLVALGVDRLFLLQLHVHDARVPFEETLGCLAELRKAGKVEHVGLCNVTVGEIQQAQRHFPVAVVQNELSIQVRKSAQDGTLAFTTEQGIPFLAYRTLGGIAKVEKLSANKVLQPMARRHHATPEQVALNAVRAAASNVIPLIGATRWTSLQSSLAALSWGLDESDRTALEAKYSFASKLEAVLPTAALASTPLANDGSEIVLVMGVQGAGKSELVAGYVERGYARLNRDILGGKLDDLIPKMHQLILSGQRRIVLDNTYPTRISRAPVIAAGRMHGIPVVCRFLDTPLPEAMINVASRMLKKYGRPLGPEEMKAFTKTDPNLPPPAAMKRWGDSFEEPQMDEGFAQLETITFTRRHDAAHNKKGLLLDVDGTLRQTISGEIYPRKPDDIVLMPGRTETLKKWVDKGYQLYFISNQSGVASGKVTQAAVESCFVRTAELLKLPIAEIAYCPHPAFPVGCYCRKPMPGLGVYLMHKHQLALEHLIVVGDMDSDEAFAKGLSATYYDAKDFFS